MDIKLLETKLELITGATKTGVIYQRNTDLFQFWGNGGLDFKLRKNGDEWYQIFRLPEPSNQEYVVPKSYIVQMGKVIDEYHRSLINNPS